MNTSTGRPASVKCPCCGTPVEWSASQPWRPFCSERCKLIDLGTWFDESNRIAGDDVTAASMVRDD